MCRAKAASDFQTEVELHRFYLSEFSLVVVVVVVSVSICVCACMCVTMRQDVKVS